MLRLLAVIVVLILYGSLYPWRIDPSEGSITGALRVLLARSGPLYPRDVLVNVIFYMPVGACAYLALRPIVRPMMAAAAAIVIGTALSMAVEIAQTFEVSRRTSIYDVYANALGSAIGAAVAAVFSKLSILLNRRRPGRHRADVGALALIVCWIAYLLFPFLPVLAADAIRAKLAHAWTFPMLAFISASVAWFVIGNAIRASGVRQARTLCAVTVLLVPAQLFIFERQPTIADLAGAVMGATLFAYTRDEQKAHQAGAWAMTALVIVLGLSPFQLTSQSHSFSWVPFLGLLLTNWYGASQILFTKLFLYGAAIWSWRIAGSKIWTAAIAVAAVLMCIEGIQLWLPRTPDITDPVLALLIGVGLDAFRSESKRISSLSGTSA